jgi:hypothetical protein
LLGRPLHYQVTAKRVVEAAPASRERIPSGALLD